MFMRSYLTLIALILVVSNLTAQPETRLNIGAFVTQHTGWEGRNYFGPEFSVSVPLSYKWQGIIGAGFSFKTIGTSPIEEKRSMFDFTLGGRYFPKENIHWFLGPILNASIWRYDFQDDGKNPGYKYPEAMFGGGLEVGYQTEVYDGILIQAIARNIYLIPNSEFESGIYKPFLFIGFSFSLEQPLYDEDLDDGE